MHFLKTMLLALVGAILGFLLFLAGENGYLERWQRLPAPPASIVELVDSGWGAIYARLETGETYRCESWKDECWLPGEASPEMHTTDVYPALTTKPCLRSAPKFWLFANAPKRIVECVEDETQYADGWMWHGYVLDGTGRVWQWAHGTSASTGTVIEMLAWVGGGITLGVLTGMLWRRRRERVLVEKPH